ncbi:unnamed protein product [Cuscuta campestris]|uniref:PROP1-like PPR domain-containing protein n=1 Tax=Cuscuta campestris TaxID=132261 RepID=A0A484LYZ1_9ASTE|nr:unnamed protein product [Cuscuta campestris]
MLLRRLLCETPKSSPFSRALSTQILLGAATTAETPSTSKYDKLIDSAGGEGDFDTVKRLLEKRGRDGLFNTCRTFKFIWNDISMLDDLLAALSGINHRFARESAHNCLIARLSKLRLTPQALRVAEIAVSGGFCSSAATFHPILIEHTKRRNFEEAWRVVGAMKALNVRPDITTYNYLLTGYCRVGDLEKAAGILTNLAEEKVGPDDRTYDALVLGACRVGKVDSALKVLRRMKEEGIVPLHSTHAHVIGAMVRLGFHKQAFQYVMACAGRDERLDCANLGELGRKMIRRRRYEDVKVVLKEMRKRGIEMGDELKEFCEWNAIDDEDDIEFPDRDKVGNGERQYGGRLPADVARR